MSRSPIDEIVREGARAMLQAALRAEVAAYVERFADRLDQEGRKLLVRNGYHNERQVLTAAGAVTVKAPRVDDKRVDAESVSGNGFPRLPAWAHKSPQVTEVLPLLYLHGLSTGDFGECSCRTTEIGASWCARGNEGHLYGPGHRQSTAGGQGVRVDCGAKYPKAVAKIPGDPDVLLEFYRYPAEHWIHLRTTNPIESTFVTVRLRTKVAKGPGSRAAGIAMAYKLIEAAGARWRKVDAPELVALVRAGALFHKGKLLERPRDITPAASVGPADTTGTEVA